MSERIAKKMREEATAHELKAGEMLRCARRLQALAGRRKTVASRLREAAAVVVGGGKRRKKRLVKTWVQSSTSTADFFGVEQ